MQASLELAYVAEAVVELSAIFLPQLPGAGITGAALLGIKGLSKETQTKSPEKQSRNLIKLLRKILDRFDHLDCNISLNVQSCMYKALQ